jgi:hypothetical protein
MFKQKVGCRLTLQRDAPRHGGIAVQCRTVGGTMKYSSFYILKAYICLFGFLISVIVFDNQESFVLFWVAILSVIASLGFYLSGE